MKSPPKIEVATIVKVVGMCLVVGFVMKFFNMTPKMIVNEIFENIDRLFGWAIGMFGDIAAYILFGAVLVVPIWLIIYLLKWIKGESS